MLCFFFSIWLNINSISGKSQRESFTFLVPPLSAVSSEVKWEGRPDQSSKADLHCLTLSLLKPEKPCHNLRCSKTIFLPDSLFPPAPDDAAHSSHACVTQIKALRLKTCLANKSITELWKLQLDGKSGVSVKIPVWFSPVRLHRGRACHLQWLMPMC